ncbi:MAG: VOC family protein [Bacteroidota bacterium]
MLNVNPYLNFNGNTEEAFNFYKSVFGGEFSTVVRFKDMPDGNPVPSDVQNKIMHISLPINKNTILMATDACESMGFKLTTGNNFYILLETESKEEADKIFNKLSTGGRVEMPMQDQIWGAYYGSFADKFGVQWMLNYTYKK